MSKYGYQVQYRGDLGEYHTIAEDGCVVGRFARRADAVLDAAAPDLLEACKGLLKWGRKNGPVGKDWKLFEQAEKALQKAEGGGQ